MPLRVGNLPVSVRHEAPDDRQRPAHVRHPKEDSLALRGSPSRRSSCRVQRAHEPQSPRLLGSGTLTNLKARYTIQCRFNFFDVPIPTIVTPKRRLWGIFALENLSDFKLHFRVTSFFFLRRAHAQGRPAGQRGTRCFRTSNRMPPVWHRFLHVLQDGTHTSQRKPTNHQHESLATYHRT